MRDTVSLGGHVVIATFAPDGPTRCSDLDVVRYSPDTLADEFGDAFVLMDTVRETHHTPWNSEQQFMYCLFKRVETDAASHS